ncbi:MAG: hypothetical protein GWN99_20460 [Gemmatimonadetes bacterium]|uniref:Uncharacterized protein n=1 Tax=Candidatus Kutchimonas denitrificans TaxID=3056748 RepID=A0AAE4ZBZ6_9BACT|nr:hypothetical protein [Gemmatimonadota bacterium]NIR76627.1 hypothetical protein [Candidatus Kutchimonas denitrificans]NIS03396.1 hypothetical protein [Gemmatimonadota bacterium]NIT69257.1 hypothetical protein [Gemmatimonadota bacterium]NIU54729.1 hypothetical protein [Gemmatimonadota bacterium]
MYRTCIHCNRSLGENETVETFPVGRRLAFDGAKGRLWVVCDNCRRWNLTPLEERWEAIEQCERSYRDTRTRYSTDNIGLARLPEGLDLVRIGKPLRPEFAAWRYGTEFLKRRIAIEASIVYNAIVAFYDHMVNNLTGKRMVIARVRDDEGNILPLNRDDMKKVRLVSADTQGGWALHVPHRSGRGLREWWLSWTASAGGSITELTGSAALRAATKVLSRLNFLGGNDVHVRRAVRLVEDAGDAEILFGERSRKGGWQPGVLFDRDVSVIKSMRPEVRLALEMAANEETERRALQGELRELEAAWREAEAVAAIADRLLVPEEIDDWIRRQRSDDAMHGRDDEEHEF